MMAVSSSLPASVSLGALIAATLLLAAATFSTDWKRLAENEPSHVWLGAVVCIALLWRIGGTVQGIRFHLLGATVLSLMFGWALALIAVALAAAAAVVFGGGNWHAFALDILVSGALPVAITWGMLTLSKRALPRHLFIYLFVCAFFAGGASMLSCGLASTAVAHFDGIQTSEDAFPMWLLLGFGEATLSGMIITLAVVYRPRWVQTFDDAQYLKRP